MKYTYTNHAGSSKYYQVNYKTRSIATNFGCSGIAEYTGSVPLVDNITLPDGSQYLFSYEQNGTSYTGRLASVTLPSGGVLTYAYTGNNHGTVCSDGSTLGLTRTLSPGGEWTYTRTQGSGNAWTTVVTSPASDETDISFQNDASGSNNFYEVQRKVYQGTNPGATLLLSTLDCYNGNYANCATTSVSSGITSVASYREWPAGSAPNAVTVTSFNTYGQATEVKAYDYGVSIGTAPSGTVLLDTITTYTALGNNIVAPTQVTVKDGTGAVKAQTTTSYDQTSVATTSGTPQHSLVTGARGNPTTVSSLTSGSSTISKTFTYFDTGNVKVATDVNGAQTTYIYNNCGNSFPTEVDLPLSLKTYSTWDCTGGVLATSTDLNGNVTTYEHNDANFWRLTKLDRPNGGSTTYTYNTTSSPWDIATSSKQTSTANITRDTILDGFARVTQTQLTSDPEGTDYVDTVYDNLGRVQSVSNPYHTTSDSTYGTTQYAYDALSRPTIVTRPDNKTVNYTYTARATKVQDEGYNSGGSSHVTRVYQSDGLGRLTSVCEVSSNTQKGSSGTPAGCGQDISATGFKTTYGRDALGNIVSVTQSAQTRTFQYDGLSRLTQEINPESGETDYIYDHTGQQGDLYTRTTPMPNHTDSSRTTATYTHDALHRLTFISYNDAYTKPVALYWDVSTWLTGQQKGRLVRQDNAGVGGCGAPCAGEEYSYDIDGNVVLKASWTPSSWNTSSVYTHYTYNLLDQQTSMVDIWGYTYTTAYDTAGRPWNLTSTLSDSNHPPTLYTVNSFNALGEITDASFGNGVERTMAYDKRGRLTSISDGANGSVYSLGLTYMPNGDVASTNDSINGNWAFAYDEFNRLSTSTCTLKCPGGGNSEAYNYNYDQYGNRWQQNRTAGTGYTQLLTFDVNNHIATANCSGGTSYYCYDVAGNLKYDAIGGNWSYDANGRIFGYTGSVTASYTTDGLGQRVERTVNGTTYDYVFDNQGHEYTKGTAGFAGWTWSNLYLGRMDVATYASASTYFAHTDNLGSIRTESDPTGSNQSGGNTRSVTNRPFGEYGNLYHPSELGFTGDLLDYPDSSTFHTSNRQYNQSLGRWMTPDPAGLASVNPMNPQTWNRYAYVANNPLARIDPSGMLMIPACEWDRTCGGGGGSGGTEDYTSERTFTELTAESDAAADEYLAAIDAMEQNTGSSGGGFWSHISNLFHGHSWNYGMQDSVTTTSVTTTIVTDGFDEPDPLVTWITDAAGLAGLFAPEGISKPLGVATAVASIRNDPSAQNIFTNLAGFIPGLEGPMAITGAFNDFLEWGIHQDRPVDHSMEIPVTVSNGEITVLNPDLDPCEGLCN
jgi:RHS repeat-associated protein